MTTFSAWVVRKNGSVDVIECKAHCASEDQLRALCRDFGEGTYQVWSSRGEFLGLEVVGEECGSFEVQDVIAGFQRGRAMQLAAA